MKNILKVVFILAVLLGLFSSDLLTRNEAVDDSPRLPVRFDQSESKNIDQNNNWGERTYHLKIFDSIEVSVSPNFRPWAGDTVTQTEFSIDVHPQNENIILFSANASDWPYTMFFGSGVYWSLDGGASWMGHDYPPFDTTETDPASVIDLNGNFYINFMDCDSNKSGQGIAVSTDNGAIWVRDTVASVVDTTWGICDKNHLMADKTADSPYENRLYCGWVEGPGGYVNNIAVRYSDNSGSSWSSSFNISGGLDAPYCTGVNLQTAANGDVYAAYAVYDDAVDVREDAIGFSKSIDGGDFWIAERVYIASNFGIRGYLKLTQIDVNSFPSMAVDRSGGAYDGRIYICWTQRGVYPAGTDPDIVLIRSLDGGITWIPPLRVNDDPIDNGKDQYFPWMTVDQSTGYVMIVFYDNRETNEFSTGVWMAVSADGGSTWQNFRVSDAFFQPKPIYGHHEKDHYQGDYIGIAALNNVAYPVWADDRTGNYQAWMSKVTFGPTTSIEPPARGSTPVEFTLEQNYPNPFNPTTTIKYSIPIKGHVSLKVFNVLGNEIKTLVNQEKPMGNYEIEFDATNLASGIYLYNLQIGKEYSETKKMILIR